MILALISDSSISKNSKFGDFCWIDFWILVKEKELSFIVGPLKKHEGKVILLNLIRQLLIL